MPTQSELDKLLIQARRIAEHREQNAEKEIRKMYKSLLKDLQLFLSDTYLQKAEDDVLSYAILQQKGGYARFLEELTKQVDLVTAKEAKLIKQTVNEVYSVCYDGMVDAVQKSVNGDELAESLKGLNGANAQQIKRAVENPVSGLTLNDTLEKHRKDIIWEIRKQVGIGLTQGDRYTSMAKRLAEQYDMGYKKAVRIARTEMHRAREAGFNDSANETQSKLTGTGLVVAKTWQTMDDGAVRPNGKKKKTGANHVLMDGQTVLQDENFELYEGSGKSGDTTPAPSQSGIASQDINCRCFV
ncbi:MAG: phage head morphogenesis protein, partial [Ruminococcus sp.]|nr:phage head morphogenesis protein [Ruminococcus sp.]